jgi:hypothetical protein
MIRAAVGRPISDRSWRDRQELDPSATIRRVISEFGCTVGVVVHRFQRSMQDVSGMWSPGRSVHIGDRSHAIATEYWISNRKGRSFKDAEFGTTGR